MTTTLRPVRARRSVPRALVAAFGWRLLLLWVLASLLCALLASMPLWSWLSAALDHSMQSVAIARGKAPLLLMEELTAQDSPMAFIAAAVRSGALLMLLVSPLLAGATVTASRQPRATFGDLLRGGLGEYGPMLRLLLWSALPMGIALALGAVAIGVNDSMQEGAILESSVTMGRNVALGIGALLVVLAHAGVEAGRGWLAADPRLRRALPAWWRGVRLLAARPIAVLSSWVIPTVVSLLLAVALLALRGRVDASGIVGFALALLLGTAIAAALAWGKVARVFAMRALAADRLARR